MRKSANLVVILLVLILAFSAIGSLGVAGKGGVSEDVELTLVANQESYSSSEQIEATLTVKNITEAEITNVELKNIVPDGYELKDGETAEKTIETLQPGESAELRVVYNPNGGLFSGTWGSIIFFGVIGFAGIALVVLIIIIICSIKKKSKKKAKTALSIFLIVLMVASMLGTPLTMDVYAKSKDAQVEIQVKVGNSKVTLRGEVTYSISEGYAVTFDAMGGTEVASQIVLSGQTPIVPEIPMRDGYIFIGWYQDQALKQEYDFSDPVTEDLTLYAKWTNVYLEVSRSEFYVGEGDTVYFYAEATTEAQSIYLKDADDDSVIIELKDDGKYSTSGDDLPNDNIYSGMLYLSADSSKTFEYYAEIDDSVTSQNVSVRFVEKLSDQELDDIATVDDKIQTEIFANEQYESMSIEDRKTLVESVLNQLIEDGMIVENSLGYNDDDYSYSFTYASGVSGTVIFKNWPTYEETAEESYSVTNLANTSLGLEMDLGDAIILWSFDQAWDEDWYREPFYNETKTEWDSVGLDTTIVWDTTVEDYMDLEGYEVIVFSGHGDYRSYTYGEKTIHSSSLLLHEESTRTKNDRYSADLTEFRVGLASVKGGTMYAILPGFFEHYYDRGDLGGSFVFAENCEFRGEYGSVNAEMVNALRNASAETVIGFHNSVMADYSRDLMKTYVDSLIEGKTAREAYDLAVGEHGTTDYFDGREDYGPTAYPLFSGNDNSRLVKSGIENGSFEMALTAKSWDQVGDVRVISTLSELDPTDRSRMAILTTGIGSAEESYLEGTEGSVISQVFRVPDDASQLKFSYNMVSEEPYEYVGSVYDDTFTATLITQAGSAEILKTGINTADWYEIDGIDFDGGDDTTYHTTWHEVSYDISAYAGQVVRLEFVVYDVGDSLYDTATLLDNIYID